MLSRAAANLYWLARYMERADNVARILEVAERASIMPNSAGEPQSCLLYTSPSPRDTG